MEKKYFLVETDSKENYYHCVKLYKAICKEVVKDYLLQSLASDMYIVNIEQVDYLNRTSEVMNRVNQECKIYSDYTEIDTIYTIR